MLTLWLRMCRRWVSRRSKSSATQGRKARRPGARLQVARLEDRVTPSVSVLSSFQGMNYGNAPGSVPPDTIAAAGPTEIVETVNTDIAIYRKDGTAILNPTSLATFFQSVGPINILSDSTVAYDELTGKFFVGDLNLTENIFGGVTSDTFLYAVSNNSSPASASDFQFFSVNLTSRDPAGSGSYWGDFPRIGWNANEYAATFNMFTTRGQLYSHPLVLNISASTPGTTTLADISGGVTNFTLAPATMHGSTTSNPMYFVEETLNSSGASTGNSIRVVTENNALATPSFTNTDVALPAADDYTKPPNATQKGSSALIQTNDSGILNAEWRGNHLVASQTVGVSSDAQAHARWYEFDTTSTATLVQAGTIGVGSGANSYFPSIALAANDVMAIDYMESSTTEYMSVYATGRTSSDASGQMEAPALVQAGQASYHGFDPAPYRAGDFSGITVDGNGTFWVANEYATSSTGLAANWGTAIGNVQVSSAAPPTITSANASPNPVNGTTTTLSATATDPNPGATITSFLWSVQSGASGVTFDANNGTSNGTCVATFAHAGPYTFLITVTDSLGASASKTVDVMVNQTPTSITVSPQSAAVADGSTKQFTATGLDQFGDTLTTQPSFTWSLASVAAGDSINATTGLYAAPPAGTPGGTNTVQASSGTLTPGTASVQYGPGPTITQGPSATLSAAGTTASLSVSATDPNAGATITSYTWAVTGGPAGVTFSSSNGTATGNNTTASFTQTGTYTFTITIVDSLGFSTTSSTTLMVGQVFTSISVSPSSTSVQRGRTKQFTATALDQFGTALTTQPTFNWSVAPGGAGGTINNTGLYTAPRRRGTDTINVTATIGTITHSASATVNVT
jgi:hypothetical protein